MPLRIPAEKRVEFENQIFYFRLKNNVNTKNFRGGLFFSRCDFSYEGRWYPTNIFSYKPLQDLWEATL